MILSRISFLGSLSTPSTEVKIDKILLRSKKCLKYILVLGSFINSKRVDEIRSYLMPYSDKSNNESMSSLIAPTLADISGTVVDIVSKVSIAFFLSLTSSGFLEILTST
jgi:hypothetical protein